MKAKTKLTKLLSILLALVMVVGLLPTVALAEEIDAFLQFADAPGEFFYRKDGGHNSEGPTEDTTFTLTEPTMITGIWTYHWRAEYYDIDFSKQTIQLKDTATDTVVYSGAVRVGHYANTGDCDWIVLPNIVLPAGTYQVIDSHNESWSALNGKGVCIVKGYSGAPSATALFSTSPIGALALLNNAKTGTEDSTWDSDTNTLTLNGVNFTTTAAAAVRLPADSTIVLNGVNTIKGGDSGSDSCYGIYAEGSLTISGSGTLNVTGGTATNGSSYGIYAEANVSITGGTVEATGGEADDYSYGIEAEYNVTIIGGTVKVTGGATNNDNSYGIYGDNVIISGGTVTATGGVASRYSLGIYAETDVTISDNADVTAEGGSATNSDSNGICADSNVTITGGTVKATAGTAKSWSVGISADSCAVSISGGTVETTGGTAGEDSYGIYAYDNVTITGGTLIAKAADSALCKAPSALPTAYQWRTSDSGDYSAFPGSAYSWDAVDSYVEIRSNFTVTVTDGTASVSKAAAGTTVTLTANAAPSGQVFDKWVVVSGSITLADASSATTTFKMPAEEVSVKATYKDAPHTHNLTLVSANPATSTAPGNKAYYTCDGCDKWFEDASGSVEITDKTSVIIPATASTPTECDGGESCPSGKFTDIKAKAWYHLYVDYAVTNGLYGGTSANTFEPEAAMTRAMLVTVLWRYEGKPMGYQNTFADVNEKNGSWYIDAVAWAASNGIVNGTGNNRFDPNGKITREQMSAILFRYAQKKGIDTSKRGDLSNFPDANKISAYAKEAVCWAVGEGIIKGSDGKILPQGKATRAQVSTILMRYIENIVKK